MKRKFAFLSAFWALAIVLLATSLPATAQDWFKTGTGLGVTKARLAAPDIAARSAAAQPLEKPFTMCCGPIWNIRACWIW